MYEAGKTGQVVTEMGRYNFAILGISEAKWTGSSQNIVQDNPENTNQLGGTNYHSLLLYRNEKAQHGHHTLLRPKE